MRISSLFKLPSRLIRGKDAAPSAGVAVKPSFSSQRKFAGDPQYARWLAGSNNEELPDEEYKKYFDLLESEMALVPAGSTELKATGFEAPQLHMAGDLSALNQDVFVESLYMDRFAVTNHEYLQFVKAGGYDQMELWPQDVWPNVLQFVDKTGLPGPRFWSQGRPAKDRMAHPVVGICWYEASAFANWAGKRLPGTAEWQWAATWGALNESSQPSLKFPWGNAFNPSKANIWQSGPVDTVPVDQYYEGATSNGIFQMAGNVWEWINTRFVHNDDERPCFAEVRGGAFDSYFESQITTSFRSGFPLLQRAPNVGFRCCVSHNAICLPEETS